MSQNQGYITKQVVSLCLTEVMFTPYFTAASTFNKYYKVFRTAVLVSLRVTDKPFSYIIYIDELISFYIRFSVLLRNCTDNHTFDVFVVG